MHVFCNLTNSFLNEIKNKLLQINKGIYYGIHQNKCKLQHYVFSKHKQNTAGRLFRDRDKIYNIEYVTFFLFMHT